MSNTHDDSIHYNCNTSHHGIETKALALDLIDPFFSKLKFESSEK